jgi:hypothetical protein
MKRTRRVIQDGFPEGSIPRRELREAFRELREKRLSRRGRASGSRAARAADCRVMPLVRRMKVAREQETSG